jgi:hypothetical protein
MRKTGARLFPVFLLALSLPAQADDAAVHKTPGEGFCRAAILSFLLVPFDSPLEPEQSSLMSAPVDPPPFIVPPVE